MLIGCALTGSGETLAPGKDVADGPPAPAAAAEPAAAALLSIPSVVVSAWLLVLDVMTAANEEAPAPPVTDDMLVGHRVEDNPPPSEVGGAPIDEAPGPVVRGCSNSASIRLS